MGLRRIVGSIAASMLVVAGTSVPASSQSTQSQNRYNFDAVTCVAANDCIAVGQAALGDNEVPPLVARWDGTKWLIVPSPTPSGALLGVSCVSGTCMAVGRHETSGGDRTLAERWNGSAWSIVPSPNVTNDTVEWLSGVACPATNECIAVGAASVRGIATALVERWNGTRWSIEIRRARPTSTDNGLNAVTCASAQSCVAVGYQSSPNWRALVERWNGTRWSLQTVVNPAGSARTYLAGVTCTATTSCNAVGNTGYSGHGVVTLVEHWDGASWTRQRSGNYPCCNRSTGELQSVACPTAATCIAVGDAFAYGLTVRGAGGSWQYQPSPQPNNIHFSGVSCVSATNCEAVGTNFALDHTRAEHWDGARWTIQPSP